MPLSKSLQSILTKTTIRVFAIFIVLIMGAATGVYFFEYRNNPQEYRSLWDAIWWVFVTVFTVGYGDIKPITVGGRLTAIFIMLVGVSMVSMITATISSIFVARKIREDQGLESFDFEDHLIVCGWNNRTESFIDTILLLSQPKKPRIILVNDLPDTQIKTILDKYAKANVKFIRGDFTSNAPLERANIRKARAVIVLPNLVSLSPTTADEKTVLATLNIKSSYPKIKVIAFIMHPENESHVKRAKADQVFISDQFMDYFIASDLIQPGLSNVLSQILNPRTENLIFIQEIPARFVGKTFGELAHHFKSQNKWMLLGVLAEVESIGLTDFLSADSSHLDAFIERKLKEAGKGLGEENRRYVLLNPADDYIIQANEKAIVLQ